MSKYTVNRRELLQGAGGLALSTGAINAIASFSEAHGMDPDMAVYDYKYRKEVDSENITAYPSVHDGKGTIGVRFFFRVDESPMPALLLIYNIPPGASEGVHTHRLGDKEAGSFDEFYYIIEGQGQMAIGDEIVPVEAGDNVFTPNGIPHGIENTSENEHLKVYLIAMTRE